MQLGDILDGGAEFHPVGREVEFHVLKNTYEHVSDEKIAEDRVVPGVVGERQHKARVKATLRFVDEQLRHEGDRQADRFLRESPLYQDGVIPPQKRTEEEFYCFLIRALRNSDNPAEPFCELKDYARFRRALVSEVVSYLLREYKRYVADEYPELATPEQVAEVVEEALGK